MSIYKIQKILCPDGQAVKGAHQQLRTCSAPSRLWIQFRVATYVKDILSRSTKNSLWIIQLGPAKIQEWVMSVPKKKCYFVDKIHAYTFVTPVWNSITHLTIKAYTQRKLWPQPLLTYVVYLTFYRKAVPQIISL